ncbi:hypothetical protein N7510_007352 [Penicillium lagena]|uniref:uncharacterized protein n=1 Tax=Penicillium lagena TaxID=94218 RepID=UPI002540012F|nr:uncharacterized protein N7510_007352 [Penicillium lagena]KAJ5610633.1 hypothetical protein N7510_007352 [Penicillium lagena]
MFELCACSRQLRLRSHHHHLQPPQHLSLPTCIPLQHLSHPLHNVTNPPDLVQRLPFGGVLGPIHHAPQRPLVDLASLASSALNILYAPHLAIPSLTQADEQCDTARPTCSQCQRARFSCPGYRDPQQLQFRDESLAVRARVHAENQELHSRATTVNNTCTVSPRSIPSPLAESSIRDESVCFFFRYYVLNDLYDIPIHPSVSQMADLAAVSPAVSGALAAVGLASLSNIRKSAGLMITANKVYTEALRLTGTALHNPTSDATLAAVLLLNMFEVCFRPSPAPLFGSMLIAAGFDMPS